MTLYYSEDNIESAVKHICKLMNKKDLITSDEVRGNLFGGYAEGGGVSYIDSGIMYYYTPIDLGDGFTPDTYGHIFVTPTNFGNQLNYSTWDIDDHRAKEIAMVSSGKAH